MPPLEAVRLAFVPPLARSNVPVKSSVDPVIEVVKPVEPPLIVKELPVSDPLSPAIVIDEPPPVKLTKPLASTLKSDELNAAKPILVASVDAIACDVCTSSAIVAGAVPSVRTGLVPAATTAPLKVIVLFDVTTGDVPVWTLIFWISAVPPLPPLLFNAPAWLIYVPVR